MSDLNTSMIEAIGLHENPFWRERVEEFYSYYTRSVKTSKDAWTWEEGSNSKWSTTSTKGSSTKRGQSVPVNPAERESPAKPGLPWKDLGLINFDLDCLSGMTASNENVSSLSGSSRCKHKVALHHHLWQLRRCSRSEHHQAPLLWFQ